MDELSVNLRYLEYKRKTIERQLPLLDDSRVEVKRLGGSTILDRGKEKAFHQRRVDKLVEMRGSLLELKEALDNAEDARSMNKAQAEFDKEEARVEALIRKEIRDIAAELTPAEALQVCGDVRGWEPERVELIARVEDLMIALGKHPAVDPDIDLYAALVELEVVKDG